MKQLNRVHLESTIKQSGGKFFTAVFTKKDGSRRILNGRLGVTSYLKGGENKVVKPSNSYMTVWDVNKKEYRTLNLATVEKISLNGETFEVVG